MLFVASDLLPRPRTFLGLLARAMFGLRLGILLVAIVGSAVGGILAFVLARTLWARPLQRELDGRPRPRLIAQAIDAESWQLMGSLPVRTAGPGFMQMTCLASADPADADLFL